MNRPMTAVAPDDVAALKALLTATEAALAASQAALAERTAALAETEEARRRLELMLDDMRRERFGASSERLGPDQYNLPLEDVEIAEGVLHAAQEKAAAMADATLEASRLARLPVKRNRGRLPAHLPRVERVIEPASTLCPCGCGPMARIGENSSERLDIVPAQFRVLVTRRPKYACRKCSGAVAQACGEARNKGSSLFGRPWSSASDCFLSGVTHSRVRSSLRDERRGSPSMGSGERCGTI